jgi:hypothetical protein
MKNGSKMVLISGNYVLLIYRVKWSKLYLLLKDNKKSTVLDT